MTNEEISTNRDNEIFSLDFIDLANWVNMNKNLRYLIVMKGPLRENDIIFPKDVANWHTSSAHYIRQSPNGRSMIENGWYIEKVWIK